MRTTHFFETWIPIPLPESDTLYGLSWRVMIFRWHTIWHNNEYAEHIQSMSLTKISGLRHCLQDTSSDELDTVLYIAILLSVESWGKAVRYKDIEGGTFTNRRTKVHPDIKYYQPLILTRAMKNWLTVMKLPSTIDTLLCKQRDTQKKKDNLIENSWLAFSLQLSSLLP